jgi:hypothetical protein
MKNFTAVKEVTESTNDKAISQWLNARPEVGTLCRASGTAYYVWPVGGVYKEISVFSKA